MAEQNDIRAGGVTPDQQNIATQWGSFDDKKRDFYLKQMSPDDKKRLRLTLEGADKSKAWTRPGGEQYVATPPTPYEDIHAPSVGANVDQFFHAITPRLAMKPVMHSPTPVDAFWNLGTDVLKAPFNVGTRAARMVWGLGAVPGQVYDVATGLLSSNPDTANKAWDQFVAMNPGQQAMDRAKQFVDTWKKQGGYRAVEDAAGDLVGLWATGKVMETPGKIAEKLPGAKGLDKYAPHNENVGGVNVPVGIGEAAPESAAGQEFIRLKRKGGVGATKFERLQEVQQERVKDVIRRTAQQTSDLIGPVQNEPGAAMGDAAETTFAKARPMYDALDGQLRTVPANFTNVSTIVQSAMKRARALGGDIGAQAQPIDITKITPEADGTINWGGYRISKTSHPDRWADLVQRGIINDAGQVTPLTAYMKVRSQLLKMRRAATDPAYKLAISNEVQSMNAVMESALKGTPLYDNWTEANRLWSKGYALREVSDAVTAATKGTPASEQAPGLSQVPTKVQGPTLVRRLNKLAEEGVLEKAFSNEEAANLRKSADILDRIQRTPVGKGQGAGAPRWRGLAHAVAGAKGPMIGAGIGALGGAVLGGLPGAEAGLVAGSSAVYLFQQLVRDPALVKAMTKVEGVEALQAVQAATTPSAFRVAVDRLAKVVRKGAVAGAAVAAEPQKPKTLAEIRAMRAQAAQNAAAR
jgi:hypothetical protein